MNPALIHHPYAVEQQVIYGLNEFGPLTLNEYQAKAAETAGNWDRIARTVPPWFYCALALCEEAGEVAGKAKKAVRDDPDGVPTTERKLALLKELGDTLWYLAMEAELLGFTLQDVAEANFAKLAGRRARGAMHGEGDDR